ncbi:MAG: ZIP family metal transporter [bacterium]|nr:ZIP family metal transporter [bacterium]
MTTIWFYTIISITAVSLISLLGAFTLLINAKKLKKVLVLFVSFSAGAMIGDAFIHLLPETIEKYGFGLKISLLIIAGIAIFFVLEKVIHWRHCHHPVTEDHIHPFAITNLVGDGIHNFIDGIIIGTSYIVSIPVGVATTIAVIIHEIPQEIGDFGVLLHGGFSKRKAIFFNLITALLSIVGGIFALVVVNYNENLVGYFIPFAAGAFIYVASADLIPELHKEIKATKSLMQFGSFILGITIMIILK